MENQENKNNFISRDEYQLSEKYNEARAEALERMFDKTIVALTDTLKEIKCELKEIRSEIKHLNLSKFERKDVEEVVNEHHIDCKTYWENAMVSILENYEAKKTKDTFNDIKKQVIAWAVAAALSAIGMFSYFMYSTDSKDREFYNKLNDITSTIEKLNTKINDKGFGYGY